MCNKVPVDEKENRRRQELNRQLHEMLVKEPSVVCWSFIFAVEQKESGNIWTCFNPDRITIYSKIGLNCATVCEISQGKRPIYSTFLPASGLGINDFFNEISEGRSWVFYMENSQGEIEVYSNISSRSEVLGAIMRVD